MSAALSYGQQRRLARWVVGIVLVLAGILLLSPLIEAYQAELVSLSQARAILPAEPNFHPSLPVLTAKLTRLRAELVTKRRSFPVAENVSTLLLDLESLASKQVTIRQFYPTKRVSVNLPKKQAQSGISVSEQQIEIEAQGPFQALHRLLARFETYAHPVGVRSIQLSELHHTSHSGEWLDLRVKLSAFLLDHAPPDTALLANLGPEMEAARQGAGVADPFATLLPATLPFPKPLPKPLPSPVLPKPISQKSSPDELGAWHLEGVMKGSEVGAIVRKDGQTSEVIRLNEDLDGWKVVAIRAREIDMTKGGLHAHLSLPSFNP